MVNGTENPLANAPEALIKAWLKTCSDLGALVKMNNNKFERYEYASIDDFMAHVRKHCQDNGLNILQTESTPPELIETKTKKGEPLMMWRAEYAFYVYHESGSIGPILRTTMVQANGAQASGSAMAYTWKQFVRSFFMVPTSDKDDPDMKATADFMHSHNSKTDLQKKATDFKKHMERKKDINELRELWDENQVFLEEVAKASDGAHKHLLAVYGKLCQALQ